MAGGKKGNQETVYTQIGESLHSMVQGEMALTGNLYAAEAAVVDVQNKFVGRIDAITMSGEVVEIKSVGLTELLQMTEPREEHRWQLEYYLGSVGAKKGKLLYVAREAPYVRRSFDVKATAEGYETGKAYVLGRRGPEASTDWQRSLRSALEEMKDPSQAAASYMKAVDDYKRFGNRLRTQQEKIERKRAISAAQGQPEGISGAGGQKQEGLIHAGVSWMIRQQMTAFGSGWRKEEQMQIARVIDAYKEGNRELRKRLGIPETPKVPKGNELIRIGQLIEEYKQENQEFKKKIGLGPIKSAGKRRPLTPAEKIEAVKRDNALLEWDLSEGRGKTKGKDLVFPSPTTTERSALKATHPSMTLGSELPLDRNPLKAFSGPLKAPVLEGNKSIQQSQSLLTEAQKPSPVTEVVQKGASQTPSPVVLQTNKPISIQKPEQKTSYIRGGKKRTALSTPNRPLMGELFGGGEIPEGKTSVASSPVVKRAQRAAPQGRVKTYEEAIKKWDIWEAVGDENFNSSKRKVYLDLERSFMPANVETKMFAGGEVWDVSARAVSQRELSPLEVQEKISPKIKAWYEALPEGAKRELDPDAVRYQSRRAYLDLMKQIDPATSKIENFRGFAPTLESIDVVKEAVANKKSLDWLVEKNVIRTDDIALLEKIAKNTGDANASGLSVLHHQSVMWERVLRDGEGGKAGIYGKIQNEVQAGRMHQTSDLGRVLRQEREVVKGVLDYMIGQETQAKKAGEVLEIVGHNAELYDMAVLRSKAETVFSKEELVPYDEFFERQKGRIHDTLIGSEKIKEKASKIDQVPASLDKVMKGEAVEQARQVSTNLSEPTLRTQTDLGMALGVIQPESVKEAHLSPFDIEVSQKVDNQLAAITTGKGEFNETAIEMMHMDETQARQAGKYNRWVQYRSQGVRLEEQYGGKIAEGILGQTTSHMGAEPPKSAISSTLGEELGTLWEKTVDWATGEKGTYGEGQKMAQEARDSASRLLEISDGKLKSVFGKLDNVLGLDNRLTKLMASGPTAKVAGLVAGLGIAAYGFPSIGEHSNRPFAPPPMKKIAPPSGDDQQYLAQHGLSQGQMASQLHHQMTDFGSGYLGFVGSELGHLGQIMARPNLSHQSSLATPPQVAQISLGGGFSLGSLSSGSRSPVGGGIIDVDFGSSFQGNKQRSPNGSKEAFKRMSHFREISSLGTAPVFLANKNRIGHTRRAA